MMLQTAVFVPDALRRLIAVLIWAVGGVYLFCSTVLRERLLC